MASQEENTNKSTGANQTGAGGTSSSNSATGSTGYVPPGGLGDVSAPSHIPHIPKYFV